MRSGSGPKKQKLLGLRCVWEQISAVDSVSGKAAGYLEFKEAFSLYSSYFNHMPDKERFRDTTTSSSWTAYPHMFAYV